MMSMKFYVNNKKYDVDDEEMKKRFLSSGLESYVYKFDNLVFKFYKEICFKYRLDEESIRYLSKIPTKRILLPKDVIYDEDHCLYGYTMKYIKPSDKEEIDNIKTEKLLKEILLIKKDLLLLKENNVFIDDLCDNNYVYNNGIYFVDPGSYEINKSKSKDYIEIMNRELMNDFVVCNLLFGNYTIDLVERKKFNEYFPLNEYIDKKIKSDLKQKELVKEYATRVFKNL